MTQVIVKVLSISALLFMVSCGSKLPAVKPYKMEIQQGNVIDSKMLMKLRPGMTKSQVRYILGTPLVLDSFHPNRWDYFYELRKQGKVVNKHRVVLNFEENQLVNVTGDVKASEGDAVAESNVIKTPKSVTPPAPKETSFWDNFKFWGDDEAEEAKEAVAAAAQAEQSATLAVPEDMTEKAAKEAADTAVEAAEQASEAVAVTTAIATDTVEAVATPEVATPEVATPEVATPEVATPEVATPEVATPEVATPEVATPEVATPEVATPEVATPEVAAEKMEAAKMEAAKMEAAKMEAQMAAEKASVPELPVEAQEQAKAVDVLTAEAVPAPPSMEEVAATEAAKVEAAAQEVAMAEEAAKAAAVESLAADQAAVKQSVNAWASAWRNKQYGAYVDSYVVGFKGKMRTRSAWLKQRKNRIANKKGAISVDIEDLEVVVDGDKASAYFYQKYQSATYRDAVNKRLDFVREKTAGIWLIVDEATVAKSERPTVSEKPTVQEITAPAETKEYLEGAIEKIGF